MDDNTCFIPGRFAFFDFDDTLFLGDSILPFLMHCMKRSIAPKRQFIKAAYAFFRFKLNSGFASGAKEITLSFLKGKTHEEINDIARDFFRTVGPKRFFRQSKAEMEQLHIEGFRVMIVSASADVYLKVLPEFLPVDAVLATPCAFDDAGRFNGNIGVTCKGKEKPLRIMEHLTKNGWTMDPDACCAYGDSYSDRFMLKMTAHPVLVNPHRKLQAHLAAPGVRQVRWSPEE